MRKKKKLLACFALCGVLAFSAATMQGAVAEEKIAENAGAAELWQEIENVTVEGNVDVPDYMKYGAFTNYQNTSVIYTVDENSDEDYLEDWERNGVKITATAENKKVYFKNVLDVSALTYDEELLVLAPLAQNRGSVDFTEIEIVLEDADNPDNYLTITVLQSRYWNRGSAIRTGTADIKPMAYRWGQKTTTELSTYGVDVCYMSFSGYTQDCKETEEHSYEEFRFRPLKLLYDAEKKTVGFTYQGGQTYDVLDLDDKTVVGYGKEWSGFTSNRVRLSVCMKGFSSASASMMVLKVFGQEMNGEQITDTTAPVLKFSDAATVVPQARVGKAYAIYDCISEDLVSGAVDCDISVIAPNGQNTTITGKEFTPVQAGYHTLVYKAVDGAGNVAERRFEVLADYGLEPIKIEYVEEQNTYYVGDEVAIPTATYAGGAGMLKSEIQVCRVGGSEKITLQDGKFKPLLAGEYLITYKAVDYIGEMGVKTAKIEVLARTKPMLAPVQKLLRLFDGVAVEVPMPTAYDYTSAVGNKLNALCEVVVKNADGSYEERIENGIFTPTKEKFGDSVLFFYTVRCNGGVGEAEEFSYSVPLMDVPESVGEYFDCDLDEFTTEYNAAGESGFIRFLTKEGVTGQPSISFVNPLLANGFSVAFAVPGNAQNFQTVTLQLRDSANSQIGFDLELRAITEGSDVGRKTYVRMGGVDYAMNGTFNSIKDGNEVASITPMSLQYEDGQIIDYSKNVVCTPSVGFDGSAFKGFPSGKVYFSVVFNDVSGSAGITFVRICNQTLYADFTRKGEPRAFEDFISPSIVLDSILPDEFHLNETVNIPFARGYDELSTHMEVYVSLQSPNGQYLYKDEKIENVNSFQIDTYGTYRLRYYTKDDNGNDKETNYTIAAKDLYAPTLVYNGAETLTRSIGDELTYASAASKVIVLDERDESPQLFVLIIAPDLSVETLTETGVQTSYTFTRKGSYCLRYYAFDSQYNIIMKDVVITVK